MKSIHINGCEYYLCYKPPITERNKPVFNRVETDNIQDILENENYVIPLGNRACIRYDKKSSTFMVTVKYGSKPTYISNYLHNKKYSIVCDYTVPNEVYNKAIEIINRGVL